MSHDLRNIGKDQEISFLNTERNAIKWNELGKCRPMCLTSVLKGEKEKDGKADAGSN